MASAASPRCATHGRSLHSTPILLLLVSFISLAAAPAQAALAACAVQVPPYGLGWYAFSMFSQR